jgi:hypothetical protein
VFEKFTRNGWADFRQRYEGTFGFFTDENKKRTLVKVTGVGEDRCTFEDSNGIGFHVKADAHDKGFAFFPPKSQFYNTEDATYLVQRTAARQFQRGITHRNINIYRVARGRLFPEAVDFPVLRKLYLENKDVREVVQRLTQANMEMTGALAISNQIALSGGVVYLYDKSIGSYETADYIQFKFKLAEPGLWRTEIMDSMRALNKTVEIT